MIVKKKLLLSLTETFHISPSSDKSFNEEKIPGQFHSWETKTLCGLVVVKHLWHADRYLKISRASWRVVFWPKAHTKSICGNMNEPAQKTSKRKLFDFTKTREFSSRILKSKRIFLDSLCYHIPHINIVYRISSGLAWKGRKNLNFPHSWTLKREEECLIGERFTMWKSRVKNWS